MGTKVLGRRHVMPEVVQSMSYLQVEGTFPSGTFLVTVDNPICTDDGDLEKALYGSFLPIPSQDMFPHWDSGVWEKERMPGAVVVVKGEDAKIKFNENRKRIRMRVVSKGDRPIQVGSHYPFIETNPELEFDRVRAHGYRLDIAAGTSIRFEPGDAKTVTLVELGGNRIIRGGNGIANGCIDDPDVKARIEENIRAGGFSHKSDPTADQDLVIEALSMDRETYSTMFGPTTGDLVRLGATELWIRVEKDFARYGEECSFGGGKTIRDGMGQASGRGDKDTLDTVVTNALIIDWSGIYKADIGIKQGMIAGIGKAGNPDITEGVSEGMIVGSCTDVIAGEGMIVTAGGIDTHVHFICPQQAEEALSSGITTMVGGGTGPR